MTKVEVKCLKVRNKRKEIDVSSCTLCPGDILTTDFLGENGKVVVFGPIGNRASIFLPEKDDIRVAVYKDNEDGREEKIDKRGAIALHPGEEIVIARKAGKIKDEIIISANQDGGGGDDELNIPDNFPWEKIFRLPKTPVAA